MLSFSTFRRNLLITPSEGSELSQQLRTTRPTISQGVWQGNLVSSNAPSEPDFSSDVTRLLQDVLFRFEVIEKCLFAFEICYGSITSELEDFS
jgi:hypothetical protein